MEWQVKWTGDLKFEVHHKNKMIMERFVVDLMAGRYSCRFWGLCGMPCPHVYCAIFEKGDNSEDYCSNYYSKATYLATYGKVKPGKPRMVRIKEPNENRSRTKYRKTGTSVTCSNYGQYRHNRRHYLNPIGRGRATPMTVPPAQPPNTPAPPSQPSNTHAPPSQLHHLSLQTLLHYHLSLQTPLHHHLGQLPCLHQHLNHPFNLHHHFSYHCQLHQHLNLCLRPKSLV
ncbi:hypothetical protein Ahy_B04g072785 [Arachis hypogaea]|uniref:SWIM-type domain-containing protein n=1 Tax=Arachis hypogaea TaxID=3818 RepID=A0A444ZNR1_ARAHY|nr:hypothetical protein Ahy_B04g072785 [Arachis hypogaea]